MAVADRRSYYKVLMLDPSADRDVVSAVYRRLAQRYHPDRDASPEAARRMAEINEAYSVLKDPVRRLEYDRDLAARRDRRANDRVMYQAGDLTFGSAGAPVGPPEGSVIDFGRYRGWTLGQIRRADPDFLEWLVRAPAGRQYRKEIEGLLARRA
jgi:curved DNA-binding protein CbpA